MKVQGIGDPSSRARIRRESSCGVSRQQVDMAKRRRRRRSWVLRDFRIQRITLKPEDFALGGNRPEPPPSDRIRKEVWTSVMALPDDVAVRTTNHHGSALARLNAMRWAFLDVLDDPLDRFSEVLMDVGDEFEAALVS